MAAHLGQIRLPFPISISHQREKHFERREKVLGQFFTPQSLASWMVEIAASHTESCDAALDPACGTGVFLTPLQQKGFREVWGIDDVDLKRDGRFVAKGSPMDKPQAYTKVGDVLFVRVGVGCLGRVAVVLQKLGLPMTTFTYCGFAPICCPSFSHFMPKPISSSSK